MCENLSMIDQLQWSIMKTLLFVQLQNIIFVIFFIGYSSIFQVNSGLIDLLSRQNVQNSHPVYGSSE